ncbi:GLIPR1-like protein 1 isoform X3 [Anneissia japonica]|uniref:GLIPR1-like protein 1 isoform X3 n=1 Tax=Anneissia japonica TaxID=1529436 RepID=UPI0014256A78|nr:GLIPR1-like protein 1 isoform X3 [Anneissia japonica]
MKLILAWCLVLIVIHNANSLREEEMKYIVDIHNEYRRNVTPNAADMRKLEWDQEVAAVAADWASRCPSGHNYGSGYGENLAFSSEPYTGNIYTTLHGALKSWYDESEHYKYNKEQCDGVCGHYTQMVDTRSLKIGCATNYNKCPGIFGYILVCNYSPAGNFNGKRPYQKGKTCSKCPDNTKFCVDKFCAACEDGNCKCKRKCKKGVLNKETCTCDCYKNKGYYGSFCSEKCKNTDDCIYESWPDENVCTSDYFTKLCPLKCHPDCAYYKKKKGF